MKKIFTLAIALMSLFAMLPTASALVYTATVPVGTIECHIAGNFPAPMNWAPTDPNGKMTKVDATHFTISLTNSDATMVYKYCSGPDWMYVEKDAAGLDVTNRTYSTADVVAKWAAVYNPTVLPKPMNVTIDVLVSDSTFQCYIVGNFNKWAGPTAPVDSIKMALISTDLVSHTKIFEKRIYSPDVNTLAYHFCSGPDWVFEQLKPTGDYKYPEVAPVVTAWKKIYDPSKVGNITVTATVPAGTGDKVWMNGSFIGWNFNAGAGGQQMTKNANGTFSGTVNNVVSFEYKLYNRQDWNFVEVNALGVEVSPNRLATATPGTTITVPITVIGWKQNYNTAVQQLNMDNYKVYSTNHSLVVEGVTSQVDVYDASGRTLQSVKMNGTFKSKSLNSGLYIIRVDGATTKVAVY